MTLMEVYFLRNLKNDCNIFLQSFSRIPPLINSRWLKNNSNGRFMHDPHAPVLGSEVPKTTLSMRAWTIAPIHIEHGSKVTYRVVFGYL